MPRIIHPDDAIVKVNVRSLLFVAISCVEVPAVRRSVRQRPPPLSWKLPLQRAVRSIYFANPQHLSHY
jgi:hypothetical protein